MTTEELTERANLHAREAVADSPVLSVLSTEELTDEMRTTAVAEMVTDVARAFVMGYMAALEETARGRRHRK